MQYDCTFSTFDGIVEEVAAQAPDIVGIYIMITMSRNALMLVERAEEKTPSALFVDRRAAPDALPGQVRALF